jgi:hypothetical protein
MVERLGHEAIVLEADVVVPPRADLLLVEPLARSGVEHARLVRAFFPGLPVLCLNPLPESAGFLGRGPTGFLPKPFTLDQLGAALATSLASTASPV